MDGFNNLLLQLTNIQWMDILDILVVAFLIYKLLPLFRSSGALRILRGIAAVFLVAGVTDLLNMYTLNFLINQILTVGLLALVILFQPELRRIMDHLGNVKVSKIFGIRQESQELDNVITQTVMACEVMSKERVGALMVFSRDNSLEEYVKSGTVIDGQVSEQLIRNIFFPKASLHDGAMIIRDGRVLAAGCVLPLSNSKRLSADLGTRHRAGVGMSEASDALVVIVSEETGTISVAVGGMLKRHLAPQTLERLLRNELMPSDTEQEENLVLKLKQRLCKSTKGANQNEK